MNAKKPTSKKSAGVGAAKNAEDWIARNKAQFGSHDGLPGVFQREQLFSRIKTGKRVTFVDLRGQLHTGSAVMRAAHGG